MTVGELIKELQTCDESLEVMMKVSNNRYVEGISGTATKELCAFYGRDRDILVLMSAGQEGAV